MKWTIKPNVFRKAIESVGGTFSFSDYSKWKPLRDGGKIQLKVNCAIATADGESKATIYRDYDNEILFQGDAKSAKAYLKNEGFVTDDEWWDKEHPGWREAQEE